jgi:hypothetical protein
MEPLGPDHSKSDALSSWGIHGEPDLLVEAARKLRLGIKMGAYHSHPPGEYAMFGIARLLDAIASAMRVSHAPHPQVVSAAAEVAHHVLSFEFSDDLDRPVPP